MMVQSSYVWVCWSQSDHECVVVGLRERERKRLFDLAKSGSRLRLSTSWFGLSLCPTQNRPDGIGFWKISPAANCRSKQVGRIRLQWVAGGLVVVVDLRKRRENSDKT